MKRRRATQITLETSQVLVFRRPTVVSVILCEECDCGMLLLEEAVAAAQVSSRVIYRWAEAGLIHFKETAEGLLLVCLKSLLAAASEKDFRPLK